MTFLDAHGDALAVLLLFIVALVLLDRAYTRTARAQRETYRALLPEPIRPAAFDEHATQALAVAVQETPLSPYAPDFTSGAREEVPSC